MKRIKFLQKSQQLDKENDGKRHDTIKMSLIFKNLNSKSEELIL